MARGNFGNPEQHARAGHAGGQKTAATHGREFYQAIGHKGGQASPGKFKPGSDRAREAGRRGGEAVSSDRQHMSDIGRSGGRSRTRER